MAEAEDRPERLTATLPFGGVTLIEHQARALIAAGAGQMIVVVGRMTPELLGALNRIGRRGVSVDAVRTAGEASAKLHPLATTIMLADGLVTTDAAIGALAGAPGDALLVIPAEDALGSWERVGGQMAWAGIARLDARRMAEMATLPADYDLQSSLLRLADQAGAVHVRLPGAAVRHGHGIEHRATALAARGRLVLASLIGGRRGWFERWVLGPVARLGLPYCVDRALGGAVVGGGGAGVAALGLLAIALGWSGAGTVLSLVGCLGIALGTTLSELRDEMVIERVQRLALAIVPALAALVLGWQASRNGSATPLVLAAAGVVAGVIGARGTPEWGRRPWWGSPPAYLLVLAVACIAGRPVWGLAIAGAYAAATLAAGVEALRAKP